MISRHHRKTAGFTLIEVLLAVAIFAVVLAAINTVFYGALRLRNQMTQRLEQSLPVQHAVSIIKQDLLGLIPPGTLAGPFQTTPSSSSAPVIGEQIGPQIYTSTAIIDEISPWSELQKVTYFLRNPTNRVTHEGRDLFRAVNRNLLAQTEENHEEQFLLGEVEEIAFEFYTGNEWRATWDSTTEETPLPRAIRVQIQLARAELGQQLPAPIELVVPVYVQGSTNNTQAAGGGR